MSDMNKFDDFLNNRLNKHTTEVPSHIWENIVAERNKRKPTGFWLGFLNNKNMLLLTGLLLAGGAGIAILSTPTNMGNSKNISSGIYTNSTSNNTIIKSSGNNKFFNNKTSNQVEYRPTSISNETTLQSTNNSSLQSVSSATATATDNNTIVNNTKTTGAANTNTVNHKSKRYLIAGIENIGIIKANTIDIQSENINDKNDNNLSTITGSSLTAKHTAHRHSIKPGVTTANATNTVGVIEDNTSSIDGADNLQTVNNNNKDNKSYFSTQHFLTNRLQDSAQKISSTEIIVPKDIVAQLHLPECPTVEKNAAGNKQYLEAYIGPDYGIRTLSDTSNPSYLEQRKQSTSFRSAFSIGARYTKVLKSGISFSAGLNYSQINEKLTYGTRIEQRPLDNNNNVRTDTITVYTTSINRYHSVDIPVLFGYELGNDKIHININAGPVANLYSWQHGSVLGTDSLPQSISSGKSSSLAYQYKTNIGLGVTGGVSIFYKLNDQLHVYAEPYFRYNFGDMTTNQAPIQQKYTTIGLHLGIRIDLK
jgi:hypothetical protein